MWQYTVNCIVLDVSYHSVSLYKLYSFNFNMSLLTFRHAVKFILFLLPFCLSLRSVLVSIDVVAIFRRLNLSLMGLDILPILFLKFNAILVQTLFNHKIFEVILLLRCHHFIFSVWLVLYNTLPQNPDTTLYTHVFWFQRTIRNKQFAMGTFLEIEGAFNNESGQ